MGLAGGSLAELLERSEPAGSRPIGELVARLRVGGRLLAILDNRVAITPADVDALPVSGLSDDSRRVRPGDLFVAIRGEHVDGHDHVAGAIAAGAVGAIVE